MIIVKNQDRFCEVEEKRCVRVCMYVCVCERERERVRDTRYTTQRIWKVKYINKGKRLNILQSGRRVLYIVTLSFH